MQIPLTIEKHLFPIQKVQDFHGEVVPFEVETYQRDYENSEKGGFFDLSNWGVVQITGPDAANYLQRMSTLNIQSLGVGKTAGGAFLTGRGTIVSIGYFLRLDQDVFLFVVSPKQLEKVLTHLEMFHFQERLEIKDRTPELALVGLWNTNEDMSKPCWPDCREPRLTYTIIERTQFEKTLLMLAKKGLSLLGMHLFHYFRIETGLPWVGWEIGESDLVLEAGLEDFVSRNKGCYPGQEVVERIFTYGQVNRRLVRVKLEGISEAENFTGRTEIKSEDGKAAGDLVSLIVSPKKDNLGVGLAFVRKAFWESVGEFQTEEGLKVKWDLIPQKGKNG